MVKTATLTARIEPKVKEQAEEILNTLGIPASSAINMFYNQIILQNGLPFEVKIPHHCIDMKSLTNEELNIELEKGYNEMLEGKGDSVEETFSSIRKEFNL